MKNNLTIDLDTERKENQIIFYKDVEPDMNDEEKAKEMVLMDLSTVCSGLLLLIKLGSDNKYFDINVMKEKLIDEIKNG